jgi:cell division protein FtsI/penicillin-binding protein 2
VKPGEIKLLAVFVGVLVFMGLVTARLVDIQIVKHDYYAGLAERQQGDVREMPARRGTIYDRHLRPLAMTLPAYLVFADPQAIEEPVATADLLSRHVPMDRRSLIRRLSDKGSRFRIIERTLDLEQGLVLEDRDIDGIYCVPSGQRVNPLGDLARNVIGLVSQADSALGGIELACDEVLRGTAGKRRFFRDARGNTRPCLGQILRKPVDGRSVVLTIDADLQEAAERALDHTVEENRARGGCVVVVEPRTGDILALASSPRHYDFAVRVVFEPGSALKICTFAAGLDLGRVDTSTVFDTNEGMLQVPGGVIRDDHPHDVVDLIEAFKYSSNVASALIARMVGSPEFYRYLRAFGFGSRTGVPLEGESAGILRDPDRWSRRSLETLAFGQEIGVTAVQLGMAFAAVANGGNLMRPRLVKAVIDAEGVVKKRTPAQTIRRVMDERTATLLVRLLEAVVQGGTGIQAGIPGIRVAGKTGTGQKAEGGRYVAGKHVPVFAGFVPSDQPRYVCVVVVDEPDAPSHYGGVVCGPVFKEVMESALKRDRRVVPDNCLRPAVAIRSRPRVLGVTASSEPVAAPPGLNTCPSVLGMTLREAAGVLGRANIRWNALGSGVVVGQDPPARAPLGADRVCTLRLADRSGG